MKLSKCSEPPIQSVSRALDLLEFVIRSSRECSVKELASSLGLHVSTVSRLLATLRLHGFLSQNSETGHYAGSYKILELSSLVAKKIKLRELAAPYLYKLMESSGETANLAVLDGTEVVFVESVENTSIVTASSRVGRRLPLHSTAAGKVFLGFMEDPFPLLARTELKRYTPKTITTIEALAAELERVRREGYAVDNEEQEVGLRCVAAPVRKSRGEVVAAVSISGPTVRLSEDRMPVVIPIVIQAAQDISKKLGFDCSNWNAKSESVEGEDRDGLGRDLRIFTA